MVMEIKSILGRFPGLKVRESLLFICLFVHLFSCSTQEEKSWGEITFTPPVNIIFDTDMLTDCDDAAALGILHKLADVGEAEILATMVTSSYPKSAPVVESINWYYNRPELPIGVPKHGAGVFRDNSSFLDSVALEFPYTLNSNDEAPNAVDLYRKILSDHPDNSVVILTVGYMSNLASLLKSEGDIYSPLRGEDLIKQKVKLWICMGGNFPIDDASDNVNFTRDSVAAYHTITNWPSEIVFVGREIGHNIHVGDRIKETPLNNPVRKAYQLHRERAKNGHWNHHTADPSAVLFAVRGLDDYWDISKPGHLHIKEDCSFIWKENPAGKHRYIIQKMDRKELGNIMETLMIMPPINK